MCEPATELAEAVEQVEAGAEGASMDELEVDLQMARAELVGNAQTIASLKEQLKAAETDLATKKTALLDSQKRISQTVLTRGQLFNPAKVVATLFAFAYSVVAATIKGLADLAAMPVRALRAYLRSQADADAEAAARAALATRGLLAVDENDQLLPVKGVVVPAGMQPFKVQSVPLQLAAAAEGTA